MPTIPAAQPPSGRQLVGAYCRTLIWYLLGMAALWLIGIEAIYGHPTPFYALYHPVFTTPSQLLVLVALFGLIYWALSQSFLQRNGLRFQVGLVVWTLCLLLFGGQTVYEYLQLRGAMPDAATTHRAVLLRQIPALLVFLVALLGLLAFQRRVHCYGAPAAAATPQASGPYTQGGTLYVPKAKQAATSTAREDFTARERAWLLLVFFGFAIAFPCAIAYLRGGLDGISQAYARSTYEYIGDIGKTPDIRSFFARYNEIHPYLSMHAKVHPPGPVVVLWLLSPISLLFGDDAVFGLSLMTILFGALGVFPLYYWVREMLTERVAIVATMLYVCMPTIVLFSATSADILFTPFTLCTLFAFERALRRESIPAAVFAGIGYACMSLLSFSLIGVGIYFALAGLWRMRDAAMRKTVVQTAAIMILFVLGTHGAVYLWSGFNVIECFQLAKQQFDTDQHHLDLLTPRLPAWTYRIINPLCWFYFAGIPVSILFIRRLIARGAAHRDVVLQCFLALVVLNLLYLARGEGERSAMYLMPFLAIPAALMIDDIGRARQSVGPLAATLAFLAFQCWFTEIYFYTYW